MKEELIIEILNKVVELLKSAVSIITAMKDQSNNNVQQKSIYARNAYTMYAPIDQIRDRQEQHRREPAEDYYNNNHKPHELGKNPPKQLDAETRRAYDNYSAERQLGKMLNEERQARLRR